MRRIRALLGIAALSVGLGSCGGDSAGGGGDTMAAAPATTAPAVTTAPTTTAPAADDRITISGFRYTVPPNVAAGAELTVRNADSAPHTVTESGTKMFDARVDGMETATFTAPSKPGSYAFFCTVHPEMKGTLVVG